MDAWERAERELGIQINRPYAVIVGSATQLIADVRILDFGGRSGMLVVRSYSDIKDHIPEIRRQGFSYSVFDANQVQYDRADFIEMLRDWGWTGSGAAPAWISA